MKIRFSVFSVPAICDGYRNGIQDKPISIEA